MYKILHIVRGLPGSGKSTKAKEIYDNIFPHVVICSTDEYWLRPDGKYDFNYDLVHVAHQWNQRRVRSAMITVTPHIIVDNVNINFSEIKPYAEMAKHWQYTVKLVEPESEWCMDVEQCYQRNTHGVPYATILRMYHEWESSEFIKRHLVQMGVNYAA